MNQLEVFPRGIPAIKQYGACPDLLVRNRSLQHLLEMVIFGLAIMLLGVDAKINWVELSIPIRVQQVDYPNPSHQTASSPTILLFHQFY